MTPTVDGGKAGCVMSSQFFFFCTFLSFCPSWREKTDGNKRILSFYLCAITLKLDFGACTPSPMRSAHKVALCVFSHGE